MKLKNLGLLCMMCKVWDSLSYIKLLHLSVQGNTLYLLKQQFEKALQLPDNIHVIPEKDSQNL